MNKVTRIITIFALTHSLMLFSAAEPISPETTEESTPEIEEFESEQSPQEFTEEQDALIDAIQEQDADAVHTALEALDKTAQSTTFLTDDDDNTPLIMAAFYGNYEVVDVIINFIEEHVGQDAAVDYINQKNVSNNSALSAAAGQFAQLNDENDPEKTQRTAYRSIMKLLIEHEATTNKATKALYPFLKSFYKDAALPEAKPTLSDAAYKKNLIQAIAFSNTHDVNAALQSLTKLKESANFLCDGNTPLKLAAARGNSMIVGLIINNLKKNNKTFASAINRVSTDDHSALSIAAEKYLTKKDTYEPIILMLLKQHAVIRPRDEKYLFLKELQQRAAQEVKEEEAERKVSFHTLRTTKE
jgi:ankyrin repeat protein